MTKSIITHVRKDKNNVITHVKANGTELSKIIVIQHILQLHMIYEVVGGERVHVVAKRYLRSDANTIEEDNLGELPSF